MTDRSGVVDQPGGADPGGHDQQRLTDEVRRHVAQRRGVDQGRVVEAEVRLLGQSLHAAAAHRVGALIGRGRCAARSARDSASATARSASER